MAQLENRLEQVLGTTYVFAACVQQYHWNVMGENFHAYHEFYQNTYDELESAIDDIAETIRGRGVLPRGTLAYFLENSDVSEDTSVVTDPRNQMEKLENDNNVIVGLLRRVAQTARDAGADDVKDFLIDRLRAHRHLGWQISAHLGRQQTT